MRLALWLLRLAALLFPMAALIGGATGNGRPKRVAGYSRVSSDDQAERQTIQSQVDFLRRFCTLYSIDVAGEYLDDGISGTVLLGDRPAGRRLLEDIAAGRIDEVIVYRLDRLGRSLKALLDAHTLLDAHGVTIRSATEPFDTSTPIGRFVFQLLGSLAELERSTIQERMTLGRDRVIRKGKWTSGPVPCGYTLDADGCLTPDDRLVPGQAITWADLARELFQRMAAGSTTIVEARRLNTIGVPTHRTYSGGATVTVSDLWRPNRINQMVRNSVYRGVHTFRSRHGNVSRDVPRLVDDETWTRAVTQLGTNRALSSRNAKRVYLLRGLIRCNNCGYRYAGTTSSSKTTPGWLGHYYRCGSQLGVLQPSLSARCRGKRIPCDWLDDAVWELCRAAVLTPTVTDLTAAQRKLGARRDDGKNPVKERASLQYQLREKADERERILTLYRRKRLSVDDVEQQLEAIAAETEELQRLLAAIESQADLAAALREQRLNRAALMANLRERVSEADGDNLPARRSIIEAMVRQITVETEGRGRSGVATVMISYSELGNGESVTFRR